jgi:hypothetical protein
VARRLAVLLLPLIASSLAACGDGTSTASRRSVNPARSTSHQDGPPRYHACGRVALAYAPSPIYAHNVSCAVAVAVAKRCSGSATRVCFGSFPLPYNGVGEPYLPHAPAFKPLGFECYQAAPPYTAGLPPPPNTMPDPKAVLCTREASLPGPDLVVVQQLVAYVV